MTANCIAPNARTRMMGPAFKLPADAADFDPLSPENNAPPANVALCADEVQGTAGQAGRFRSGHTHQPQTNGGPGVFTRTA